jgi:hypothetical protein
MRHLKSQTLIEAERRKVIARGWGQKDMASCSAVKIVLVL